MDDKLLSMIFLQMDHLIQDSRSDGNNNGNLTGTNEFVQKSKIDGTSKQAPSIW